MSKLSYDVTENKYYQRGRYDYDDGKKISECPFSSSTAAQKWRNGWWAAQDDARDPS